MIERICIHNPSKEDKELFIIETSTSEGNEKIYVPPRVSNSYIIHFLLKGEGEYNGERISEGMGFIICPNQTNTFTYYDNTPFMHCWISLTGTKAKKCISEVGLDNKNQTFTFHHSEEIIKFVQEKIKTKNIITQIDFLMSFFFLLSKINYDSVKKLKSSELREFYVSKTKSYVKNYCSSNIQVKDIAESLHITAKHLYRVFLEETGMRIKEYIITEKMNIAKELLINTDLKIHHIAHSVGYDSEYNFSHSFKKHCNMTPTEYRKTEVKIPISLS